MKIVRKVKDFKGSKTYRLLVKFDKPVDKKVIKNLKNLIGPIEQKTPQRVLHRRADLLRRREVKEIKYKIINKRTIELRVEGTAGLYVKELVTGDNGRTKPSVSDILNRKCTVKELDVIGIEKITI